MRKTHLANEETHLANIEEANNKEIICCLEIKILDYQDTLTNKQN